MKPNKQVRSPEAAQAWFIENGVCVSDWCRKNNLNRHTVVDLLHGRLKGRRGKAHHAAVALGLKQDPTGKVAA